MLKSVIIVAVLGASGVALAQERFGTDPERESAAAGASRPRCDVMSREEMLFCQSAQQSGASGVRNSICDSVNADLIERCLVQQESISSDPANEFKNRDERAASG